MKDLAGKLKLLQFTFQKTSDIVRNIVAIERKCEALLKITGMIEEIKLKILDEKLKRNDDQEAITEWNKNIEQVEVVDAEVEKLQKHFNEMKANKASKAKGEADRMQLNLQ